MEELLSGQEEQGRAASAQNLPRRGRGAEKPVGDTARIFSAAMNRYCWTWARAELPVWSSNATHFVYQDQRYDLSWPVVAGARFPSFFRLQATEHYLAWDLVRQGQKLAICPMPIFNLTYGCVGGRSYAAPEATDSAKVPRYATGAVDL